MVFHITVFPGYKKDVIDMVNLPIMLGPRISQLLDFSGNYLKKKRLDTQYQPF